MTGMVGSKHWTDWWQKVINAKDIGVSDAVADDVFDLADAMMKRRKKK